MIVRRLASGCLLLALMGGCAQNGAAPAGGASLADPKVRTDDAENAKTLTPPSSAVPGEGSKGLAPDSVVASVYSKPITAEQLYRPVMEAYGLNFVLHLAQVELCRQKAEAAKVTVTAEDIASERQRTLEQMFAEAVPDDGKMSPEELKAFRQKEYERLLDQFLETKRVSRPEFELATTTNAYLRKLAEPGLREQIKEEHVQEGFKIMFGEKVQVRHIQLTRMQELPEVQRRLAAGESFEDVARKLSTDQNSRSGGGRLRAFSRAEPMWPDAFKDAAFALKEPGEVSGPVSTGESIHLIQLIGKIPPNSAVKYETHKDYVREKIYEGLLAVRIGQLRESLRQEAPRALKIAEPVLHKQYVDRQEKAAGGAVKSREDLRKEIELDNRKAATQPATTQPAGEGGRPATSEPEGLRPPATRPAE